MNVFFIIMAFSSISELVLPQKTGHPDSLIDEMKRNMTVLMNTVDRMQSQLTIMDLQYKLQENVLNEQALNISQQQSQLRTMELENKLMNRTLEMLQGFLAEQRQNISRQQSQLTSVKLENKRMNRTIETQQGLLLNQTLAMSSQRADVEAGKQLISRLEEGVNKTIGAYNIVLNDVVGQLKAYKKESENNLDNFTRSIKNIETKFHYISLSDLEAVTKLAYLNTSLQLMNRTIEMQKGLLLNQTLAMNSQKADVEADKQLIARLKEEVNKTNGAFNIILNDVVNKLNSYQSETERNIHNVTRGMTNIENQFHYVTLTTLGAVKQLTDFNISLSTRLHTLENQQLDMNSSTSVSMTGIRQQLHYLNTSLPAWLHKLENQQLEINSSTIVSMGDIRQQLHYLNSSLPVWLQNLENQLLGLNSSTVVMLGALRHQIQHLNSTLYSNPDVGNIQKSLEQLNSTMQEEIRDIAFTATDNGNKSSLNNQKVIYGRVITNVGNGYNTRTGVFTCPRGGVYVFTWTTMSGNSRQYCYAFIFRNGYRLLGTESYEENGGSYEVASNTAVLSLTVGDRVWIQTETCRYFWGYPYTAFSGWKL